MITLAAPPDSDVPTRHARRRFTAAYDIEILRKKTVLDPRMKKLTQENRRLASRLPQAEAVGSSIRRPRRCMPPRSILVGIRPAIIV
jgi:hypothetical protein